MALHIGFPLTPGADHELYLLTYELVAIGKTEIECCEIGTPLTRTSIVLDGTLDELGIGEGLTAIDGGISITELVFPEFVRGDCNNDGFLRLADGSAS